MRLVDDEEVAEYEGNPTGLGELVIMRQLESLSAENESLKRQRNWLAGGAIAAGVLWLAFRKPSAQVVQRKY